MKKLLWVLFSLSVCQMKLFAGQTGINAVIAVDSNLLDDIYLMNQQADIIVLTLSVSEEYDYVQVPSSILKEMHDLKNDYSEATFSLIEYGLPGEWEIFDSVNTIE